MAKPIYKLSFFIIALTSFIFNVSPVMALTAAKGTTLGNDVSMISASPSIVDQVISPGKSATFSITLHNFSDQPMPLYASTEPFNYQGYVDNGATKWFTFQQPDLLILPQQSQTETVNVDVPKQAEAGAHYATIYFTPLVPVDALQSNKSPIVIRVGILTSIIVRGLIKQSAYLKPIKASMSSQGGPVSISLSIVNNGNVYLLPHGSITIYKGNKQIKTYQLSGQVIFPNTTYTYNRTWSNHSTFGSYRLKGNIVYGSSNVNLETATLTFSVSPWDLIIEAVIAILVLGITYKITKKRLRRALKALLTSSK